NVQGAANPRMSKGKRDRRSVEYQRDLALEVSAKCGSQIRAFTVVSNESAGQDEVRGPGEQHHCSVECHRQGGEMVLAHPAGDEGDQRQPKQQMQVGPEDAAVNKPGRLQEMVVVVPVDADKDK